jgi:hypothetical protein
MSVEPTNVLGTALLPCSYDPLTGYFRDGCCNTDENDRGSLVILRSGDSGIFRFLALKRQ